MSKFNTYAKQAETIAKERMAEYQAAIERLKKAEAARRANPKRGGIVSGDYAAKSARAEADYLEAKEAVRAAKAKMEAGKSELDRIKKALAADIESSYAADPAQLDSATGSVVKSYEVSGVGKDSRMLATASGTLIIDKDGKGSEYLVLNLGDGSLRSTAQE